MPMRCRCKLLVNVTVFVLCYTQAAEQCLLRHEFVSTIIETSTAQVLLANGPFCKNVTICGQLPKN